MNANLLKSEIVKNGLTQGDIAKALGMSKNTFTSRMQGKSDFGLEEANKICEILHIDDGKLKLAIFFS